MTTTALDQVVALEIPAEYVDDFRRGVVRELQSVSDWYKGEDKDLSEALEDQHLEDNGRVSRANCNRGAAFSALRKYTLILGQLPDDDACVITGEAGNLRHLLGTVGKLWANQIRGRFDYAPADLESLPPLIERLQWVVEQATITGTW